jgi:hypothetical protein
MDDGYSVMGAPRQGSSSVCLGAYAGAQGKGSAPASVAALFTAPWLCFMPRLALSPVALHRLGSPPPQMLLLSASTYMAQENYSQPY